MSEIFPQTAGADKVKSYWNRPGGKAGVVIGLVIFGLISYYAFPFLTAMVWNTINLAIACVVAFVLFMILSNKKLWMGLFYLYEIVIKKFIGIIIELDPFIIAEDYISDIEREREVLYEKCIDVDSQKEALDAKIKEKEKERKKQLDIASAANSKGMTMELANATRQASRLESYILQLTPIKKNLENIGEYLTKVHKNSKYMLDDMKNDLALKKDLYNSVTKGNNALKSAMKIFNGDPEKKMLVEQSMDYLKDDIANKLASMKKAISYSSDFMKSIDLENASFEAEGLRMLEEYKPELFVFDGNSSKQAQKITVSSYNTSQYDDLIK